MIIAVQVLLTVKTSLLIFFNLKLKLKLLLISEKKLILPNILITILCAALDLLFLSPFYIIIVNAFKTKRELFKDTLSLPITYTMMYTNNLKSINILCGLEKDLVIVRGDLDNLVYNKNPIIGGSQETDPDLVVGENDKFIKTYDKLVNSTSTEGVKQWKSIKSEINQYKVERKEVIKSVQNGNYNQASDEFVTKVEITRNIMFDNLDSLISLNNKQSENFYNENNTKVIKVGSEI